VQEPQGRTPGERLRDALQDGLTRRDLTMVQLEARSVLGHTTVSNALNRTDRVPSKRTVAALAKALGLEDGPLLELWRAASAPSGTPSLPGPGVPIEQCDPLDLEVHPAADGPGREAAAPMPGYVRRTHDEQLAQLVTRAAGGRSTMAVLVGSSSTGKTRACWEAVQPLASLGWGLWHPVDPTRADAALAGLAAVGPHTVVWLNEAQHYLDAGERLAAALHTLLTDSARAPVLVLATLWPEYDQAYAAPTRPGEPDRHTRARELLARRRIAVPDDFDEAALQKAAKLAGDGDQLLAGVLQRAHGGRVAQHLAGAPELQRRYDGASPAAKGLLRAAVDARRLGVGPHLPLGFLADAASGYLHPDDHDTLADDWLEHALAELAKPVHGNLAPLRRIRELPSYDPCGNGPAAASARPVYRLADYLEQTGRHERWDQCPPASFWHAAHTHLTDPDTLWYLARAAMLRARYRWADALYRRAEDAGSTDALIGLVELRMDRGDTQGLKVLFHREDVQEELFEYYTGWGEGGDRQGAWAVALRTADAASADPLVLAAQRENGGDREGAEALYKRAIDAGDNRALLELAMLRFGHGDRAGAEALCRRAINAGNILALMLLSMLWALRGYRQGAAPIQRYGFDPDGTPSPPW
jgi:hypothetical protein